MNKKNIQKAFKDTFITIAMPAYNEEGNIEHVVTEAFRVLKEITKNHEVLVVNDCSTDNTKAILEKLQKKHKKLRVLHHKVNLGVGHANYHIYKEVKGDILFWNASDNQIHQHEIYKMLPHIKSHDIVVGERMNRADHWLRKNLTRAFNLSFRMRFGINIRDIDSVKVFRTSTFKKIKLTSKTAFIETEMLIRAAKKKLKVTEVPIEHHPRLAGVPQGFKLRIIVPQLTEYAKYFFFLKR